MPRSVQQKAVASFSPRYESRAPPAYDSSTFIESRSARKVVSSPEADRTTTANGSPLSTRAGRHQPLPSVTPSMTLVLDLE